MSNNPDGAMISRTAISLFLKFASLLAVLFTELAANNGKQKSPNYRSTSFAPSLTSVLCLLGSFFVII